MRRFSLAKHWLCALLLCALLPSWCHAKAAPISTITLMPWDFSREPALASRLRKAGFNHVTLYVPWTDVEPTQGQFDFSKFDRQIDSLKSAGLSTILLLDFGGREYFNDDGTKSGRSVIPTWFSKQFSASYMRDFAGKLTPQLALNDRTARAFTTAFVTRAVEHFSAAHGQTVLGYAIGLQEEHEIKFGQLDYTWRDYAAASVTEFRALSNNSFPVLNYNNAIGQGAPTREPALSSHQRYREAQLKDAMCHYAGVVRREKQNTIAYFGETFTSHDAIYATGAVEELADCVDIAVIDFNFYDGYSLVPSPDTLPLMANYLVHSGYKKIIVGAYGEKWVQQGRATALMPHIKRSIEKALRIPEVIGYEIGGFQRSRSANQSGTVDFDQLDRLAIAGPREQKPSKRERLRIGLFASKSNFYFWHGERAQDRNIHQDALTQAYRRLSEESDFEVVVIGEKALRENEPLIRSLHALVVPHQAALPAPVKERLRTYWAQGGSLVQDMRLGEFGIDGVPTDDWLHSVFGIQTVQWVQEPSQFVYQDALINLDMRGRTYVNHAILTARPGYVVGAKLVGTQQQGWRAWVSRARTKIFGASHLSSTPDHGLILRGERSLVFGFLPQLTDGAEARTWQRAFTAEVRALAVRQAHRHRVETPEIDVQLENMGLPTLGRESAPPPVPLPTITSATRR